MRTVSISSRLARGGYSYPKHAMGEKKMLDGGFPRWFPLKVYIGVYHIDTEKEIKLQKTIESVLLRYLSEYNKYLKIFEFKYDSIQCCIKSFAEQDTMVLVLAAGSSKAIKDGSASSYEKYDDVVEDIKMAFPDKPNFDYMVTLRYATDEGDARGLLNRLTGDVGLTVRSAGIVSGSILGTLKWVVGGSFSIAHREIVLIPYWSKVAPGTVWRLCSDVSYLAMYAGEINRLYSDRKLMFDQIDASEKGTQLRINEILAEMRRPIDEIQLEDLEKILKEITIQFSRLSTLASSMRRDHIRANNLFRGMRSLLREWNERPIGEDPTNTSAYINDFETIIAPFGDFVARTEAVMTQLNTVLDSVRTYLGIRQQKMSFAEQASSREQLVRLVNLQEILHKLEILIVAFYLTEMARMVFESLVHESANIYTVAFIPVAFLASVLLSRLLHRAH